MQTDLFQGDWALGRALGPLPGQLCGLAVVEWWNKREGQKQGEVYGSGSFRKEGRRDTGGWRGDGGLDPENCLPLKVGRAGMCRQEEGRVGETRQVLDIGGGPEWKPQSGGGDGS